MTKKNEFRKWARKLLPGSKISVLMCLGILGTAAWMALPSRATAQSNNAVAAGENDQARTMTGQVTGNGDAAISGAVVYLKNLRSLAVKTYITDDKGNFRFHGLSPNADFEIYAEFQGQRSKTRSLSAFDSRAEVTINLHIDKK